MILQSRGVINNRTLRIPSCFPEFQIISASMCDQNRTKRERLGAIWRPPNTHSSSAQGAGGRRNRTIRRNETGNRDTRQSSVECRPDVHRPRALLGRPADTICLYLDRRTSVSLLRSVSGHCLSQTTRGHDGVRSMDNARLTCARLNHGLSVLGWRSE